MAKSRPRLLVTGFGPFPGAPDNPTGRLVRALALEPAESFGAALFKAVVLPTEYARSLAMLRRLYPGFEPDVVVHFGLAGRARAIHVEAVARNVVDPAKPDAVGMAPRSGRVRRGGPDVLTPTLAVDDVVQALTEAGFPAVLSEDAGDYVCNATLYRSLHAAPPGRRVGLIHVPQLGRLTHDDLLEAARIALRAALDRSTS